MDFLVVIFVILAIIIITVGIFYSSVLERKRREALQRLANQINLSFAYGDLFNIETTYEYHSLFREGTDDRYAYNILYGNYRNRPIKCFDYHYATYSHGKHGRTKHNHYYSGVLVELNITMQYLFVRSETFLDKIAGAVGFDDIDFESAEFSRNFYVKSEDKKFAYDVIHQRMMEFLLSRPRYHIELYNRTILIYQGGTLKPENVEYMLNMATDFVNLFPDYLLQKLS